MNIALDFDETYTLDPTLWDVFINAAVRKGHKVFCVTMRNDDEMMEVYSQLNGKVNAIFNTSRHAKLPYMNKVGIKIDVWIDDRPDFILNNAG